MVNVVKSGSYRVVRSGAHRLLSLGRESYLWLTAPGIGPVLVPHPGHHPAGPALESGFFTLSSVESEPGLTTGTHLELHPRAGSLHEFLLRTGLPERRMGRIIPINELLARAEARPKASRDQ